MKKFVKVNVSNSRNLSRSKSIKASTGMSAADIHPALDALDYEAYRAGYDVITQGDSLDNVTFKLVARKDADMMPILNVWLDTSELNTKGKIYAECTAKFPTLDTRKLDYYDSGSHWISTWRDVGKFMEWIINFSIVLDD